MAPAPDRKSHVQTRPAFEGQRKAPAPPVEGVDAHLHQTISFQRLQGGSEGGAVGVQQAGDLRHAGRRLLIDRVQQRELTARQTQRPQRRIEPTRQRSGRPLGPQAQAGVTDEVGGFERYDD